MTTAKKHIYAICWYEYDSLMEHLFTHPELKTQDQFRKDFESLMIELADSIRANYGDEAEWIQPWFEYVLPRMSLLGYVRYYREPCKCALIYDGSRPTDPDFSFLHTNKGVTECYKK